MIGKKRKIDRIDRLVLELLYPEKPGIGDVSIPLEPRRSCPVHHRKDRCYIIVRRRSRARQAGRASGPVPHPPRA